MYERFFLNLISVDHLDIRYSEIYKINIHSICDLLKNQLLYKVKRSVNNELTKTFFLLTKKLYNNGPLVKRTFTEHRGLKKITKPPYSKSKFVYVTKFLLFQNSSVSVSSTLILFTCQDIGLYKYLRASSDDEYRKICSMVDRCGIT